MALDPSTFRQAQGIATLPANPDDSGNEPTQPSPVSDTLQPPAAQPNPPIQLQPSRAVPAQPRPVQPAQPPVQPDTTPGNFFRRLGHSFAGALIGTLAGSPGADYSVDDSGKTVATPRPDNARSRIQRIAQAVLEGLAHGAAVDSRQYPSGFSKAAAGFGAGFVGTQQRQQAQDAQARQQSQQDYERQQKKIMDRAVLGIHNAQMANYWMDAEQKQINMDTEGNNNDAIAQNIEDYLSSNPQAGHGPNDISVQRLSSEEGKAALTKQMSGDPHTAESHPLGNSTILVGKLVPMRDGDGNPIRNEDGSYKLTRQFVRITGSADGKFAAPPAWVDEVKKYSSIMGYSGGQLEPGQDITLKQFAAINTKLVAAKKKVSDAWDNAEQGFDKDKNPILINKLAASLGLPGSTRPYQPGTTPNIENKPAKEASDISLNKAKENQANAAAEKDRSAAKNASDKPIYAYNTQSKQLEQTTRADIAAKPGVYTNPVDVKEADIRKDQDLARQLGDAQLNLSRYRAAAAKMDDPSFVGLGALGGSKRAMAALIGDDKFKTEFMGAQIPSDWANKLLTSANWKQLSKPQQDAVIGYIGARGAVIAYQKAVSGSGRSNKEQLELELQNIPSPLLDPEIREKQFERFQQNIDQTGAGLPKMVGVDRPQEIRQRIEAEEAQRNGATHIYEPNSGRAIPVNSTPVKNIFGKIIGYKDAHDRVTMFPKP